MFLSPVLWVIAVTIIRAAILFLYIHLFATRRFLIACYSVLAFNLLLGASAVIADCLICRPISYRWAGNIDGSCGDQRALDMCIAVFNLLQDVVVVVLPMPVLWGLRIPRDKKVALSCMFGIGILYGTPKFPAKHEMLTSGRICAITIYRVKVTSTIGDPADLHAQDIYCDIALLTSLEALLGVISACLPLLKPLLHKFIDSRSGRGTEQKRSLTSGTIHVAMRMSQVSSAPSEKPSSSASVSKADPSWYEEEVKGQHKDQISA